MACDQWGNNGWCLRDAQLVLTASDPQGYDLSISGSAGSVSIDCDGSCTIDLPAGSGVATYKVTAQQSNLTDSGSTGWKYDSDLPSVDLNASGTDGASGWYISPVTLSVTGLDATSGLAGAFLSVNGGAWQSSVTLDEGIYDIVVSAADKAGNVATASTTISIDATTPSINLSATGTTGANGWYVSALEVNADASDGTSGIDTFEVAVDGGTYRPYTGPLSFSEGQHTLQFRATDEAGNQTETALRDYAVDAVGPTIDLPASWELGQTAKYTVKDGGSGLARVRVVIEDDDERYAKVAWNESPGGNIFKGEIEWDGRFKDGAPAPPGTYLAWVKAKDQAGNESVKLGEIVVPENGNPIIAVLFPTKAPAPAATEPPAAIQTPQVSIFGGQPSPMTASSDSPQVIGNLQPVPASPSAFPWWLVAAAAGAVSYATTKPKRGPSAYQRIARAYAAAMQEKKEREKEARELELAYYASARQAQIDQEEQRKLERSRAADAARWSGMAAREQAKEAAKQEAYGDYRKGEREPEKVQPKPWWQQAVDFVQEKVVQPIRQALTPEPEISGKGLGLNSLALNHAPEDDPPPWQPIIDFFKWVGSLFSGGKSNSSPTPDVSATVQALAAQMIAGTATASAQTVVPTAASTPTPFITPTPARILMVVLADGLNLRSQPTTSANPILVTIPKGSIVYVDSNSVPVIQEGYCWRQITYTDPTINAGAIAASPDFLNPLSDFYRATAQGASITYNNAVPGWDGKHIGNDLAPLPGTNPNPPVLTSAKGIVINAGVETLNGKISGYGNYVLVEYQADVLPASILSIPEHNPGDSLYAMYAHLLNDMKDVFHPGDLVAPGMQIGTMGASGNTGGWIHLHVELRFGERATKENNLINLNASNGDWYDAHKLPPVDPALIFTPNDTQAGWAVQSQWDAQAQCAAGEPYLGSP
jgi:murein DD-endopeptidase MepM/ murein hydrolase activator NlpD